MLCRSFKLATWAALVALMLEVASGAALATACGSDAGAGRDHASATTPVARTLAGTWRRLPAAPIAPDYASSVWTGKQMIVFGRQFSKASQPDVAASYDPHTNRWVRLSPPPLDAFPADRVIWTGDKLVVWHPFTTLIYDPRAKAWNRLARGHGGHHGLVAWTGREIVAWGGGCCADALSDGVAYNPATNRWRKLAPSPLAGSQAPMGAWTGRELLIFVDGEVADRPGMFWPARLARAAAYNLRTNTWRRIARLPERRLGASMVWDGHELLVVGGTSRLSRTALPHTTGFAYDPATDRWRRLAPMPSGRSGAAAVWTGTRMLVWGGGARQGVAYDPGTDRWSTLPRDPLRGRGARTAVWTGSELMLWGATGSKDTVLRDGAVFRPATP